MNIDEMNTAKAASDDRSEPAREGKHGGRNHHRRGKGRHPGGKNPAKTEKQTGLPKQEDALPSGNAASVPPSREGQKKPRNDRRENREKREKTAEPVAAVQDTEAERRSRPSVGRPQRAVHRSNTSAELPDMDDLLIEDGMVAAETILPTQTDEADAAEIERILAHDPFAYPTATEAFDPSVEVPEGKVMIVGVRFRAGGKTYFFDPEKALYTVGQYAIVETARGLEFGEICLGNRLLDESAVVPPLRPVVRAATEADMAHNRENHAKEDEAFRIGVQKIHEHGLDMKLVSVQYTFDNSKLLFYFTSAKRVDFRELVKDLAGIFHIRIELRQIGIRDEARMIGGLGPCGRSLCCNTFLSDFGQVSMKMAKEQNLSLNSTKISGCCGRLMCCLRYEHETYVSEIRKTPAVGAFVNTPDGPGVVTEVFVLQEEVKVSLRNQPDSAPKKYKRDLVELQSRDRRVIPVADSEDDTEMDTEPDLVE